MITLDLPQATPSLNVVNRMHWRNRHKMRGDWQWMVKCAVLSHKIVVKLLPHARITIERYGPRVLDQDNFIGGAKQLLDSLVWEGFIENDSPEHLTAQYVQHIGKPARTIVHIEVA